MTDEIRARVRTGYHYRSMNRFRRLYSAFFLGIQRRRRHGLEFKPFTARIILENRLVLDYAWTIGSGLRRPYFTA